MTDDLQAYAQAAREAAMVGADILEHWRSRFQVREKGRADLVTEADLASQKAVFSYLASRFPNHAFLGEEEAAPKTRPAPEAPPTWIVDPLDGTTNYVHDCPLYCVSIGLQIAGQMVVGVVYDPGRKEMFWGARGMGAWLGQRRLAVSSVNRLQDALLSTGFPPDPRGSEEAFAWWRFFSLRTQSLRRTGSTALNLAWLAAGRFDGYWAFDNHAWDVAGGMVLVQEAGGASTNCDGSPYDPYTPDALVSNGLLHSALLQAMREGP